VVVVALVAGLVAALACPVHSAKVIGQFPVRSGRVPTWYKRDVVQPRGTTRWTNVVHGTLLSTVYLYHVVNLVQNIVCTTLYHVAIP